MPTERDSSLTFEAFDALQRKPLAQRLEAFMAFERTLIEGSLVISLNAAFGSGKTAFLVMWENDLLARRQGTNGATDGEGDAELPVPIPVRLNAWEDDFCGDPLIAIVSGLTAALDEQKPEEIQAPKRKAILKAAEEVSRFAFLAANQVVANTIGANLNDLQKQARAETEGVSPEPPPSFVQAFHDRKNALRKLKVALKDSFPGGEGASGIVFVDELDRCRPSYAVEYLETIKHVFDVPGLMFILAVDRRQLQASVEALFGHSIDFAGYFQKFVHRQISFPAVESHVVSNFLSGYYRRFIDTGSRVSVLRGQMSEHDTEVFSSVGNMLQLTLRDTQEAYRIFGHCASAPREGNWQFGEVLLRAAYFMCGCAVKNDCLFFEIGERRLTTAEFISKIQPLVTRLEDKGKGDTWLKLLAVGYLYRNEKEPRVVATELLEGGVFVDKSPEGFELAVDEVREWQGYWAYSRVREPFRFIFELISGVRRFAKQGGN